MIIIIIITSIPLVVVLDFTLSLKKLTDRQNIIISDNYIYSYNYLCITMITPHASLWSLLMHHYNITHFIELCLQHYEGLRSNSMSFFRDIDTIRTRIRGVWRQYVNIHHINSWFFSTFTKIIYGSSGIELMTVIMTTMMMIVMKMMMIAISSRHKS